MRKRVGRPKKKAGTQAVGVSLSLPPELYRNLRRQADLEAISLSGLVAREMETALKRLERKG